MPDTRKIKTVVLLSGGGTTYAAIQQYANTRNAAFEITHVVSDQRQAYGLMRAQQAGVPVHCVDYSKYPKRADFDRAILDYVKNLTPDLVVLAGFMRIVNRNFVRTFDGRLLNIHPSLLPKYPGLNTYQRVLDAGDATHGSSVHFVNDVLDGGPVICQAIVNIENNDTVDTLSARVQRAERKLYPVVIDWFARGRLQQRDGLAWLDSTPLYEPRQFHHDAEKGEQNLAS